MLTTSFYLLLTISIVAKCIDCYVIDNNVALPRLLAKSQTDDKPNDFLIEDNSNVEIDSTLNSTAIDNASEMSKSTEATDYYYHSMLRTNGEGNSASDVETGRKKYTIKYGKLGKYGKIGKKKKYSKILYPIIIGVFITKMIMFPLFVKAVTILSSAAFVFSKMSLLASLVLGLKFFLTNNNQNNDSKVEIVHVPLKKYGGSEWDRETSETRLHNVFTDNIYGHELRPTRFVP